MKTNFYLKADQKYKDTNGKDTNEERPINLYFAFDGLRGKYATGLSVAPKEWNEAKDVQRVKKSNIKYQAINDFLKKLEDQPEIIEKAGKAKGDIVTVDYIRQGLDKFLNKNEDKKTTFFGYYDLFKVSKERSGLGKKTIQKIVTLKKHLQTFERETGNKLSFDAMNSDMYEHLTAWYFDNGKKNPTVYKEIALLKTFLHWSLEKEYNTSIKFIKAFKVFDNEKEVIALNRFELGLLENYQPKERHLQDIKSVFLFACYTTLRWSDVFNLKPANIQGDEMVYTTIKTATPHRIPLISQAVKILAKYKNDPTLKAINESEGTNKALPVLSNAKTNEHLQELLAKVGGSFTEDAIKVTFSGKSRKDETVKRHELISFHCGRRTGITQFLKKMTPFDVMKISGHKDFKSFQKYVGYDKTELKEATLKAWNTEPVKLRRVV